MKILRIFIAFFIVGIVAYPVMATSILLQQPEVVVRQSPLIVEVIV